MHAFDNLAQPLGLGGDRGHVILKLRDAPAQVDVFARQVRRKLAHRRRFLPSMAKAGGRSSALRTHSVAATKSADINEPEEASRRKQSTASVAAHARRRTQQMGMRRPDC